MSKHSPAKALHIRLPEDLRQKLVRQTPDWRPLPYLMRRAVRHGLSALKNQDAAQMTAIAPGTCRPALLQLPPGEFRQVSQVARETGLPAEVATLSLIAIGLS